MCGRGKKVKRESGASVYYYYLLAQETAFDVVFAAGTAVLYVCSCLLVTRVCVCVSATTLTQ